MPNLDRLVFIGRDFDEARTKIAAIRVSLQSALDRQDGDNSI